MRKVYSIFAVLLLTLAPEVFAQGQLHSIFNGDNFEGWILPEDNIWWKAGDGVLSVKNGPDQKGSTLWTDAKYGNFIIDFEFKMGDGVVDSGIFMRSDHDQIQIGISGSLQRDMTASPYIPGKGYPVEAEGVAGLLDVDGWNQMTIVAVGDNYSTWLNGKKVMSYNSETATEKGPIGIQLHANREMAIAYRNLYAAELP